MDRANYSLLLIFFLLLNFATTAQVNTNDTTKSRDESSAIYSMLLENMPRTNSETGQKVKLYVVHNYAVTNDSPFSVERVLRNRRVVLSSAYRRALSDYKKQNEREQNQISESFSPALDGLQNVLLIDSEQYNAAFDGDDIYGRWASYYKTYPNSAGVIGFSMVGFGDERRHGFVYMEQSCGALCGQGDYYLLVKKGNKWQISKKVWAWIS